MKSIYKFIIFASVPFLIFSCESPKNKAEITFDSPQEFANHLNSYIDSIKIYNENWNLELKSLSEKKSENIEKLKTIRAQYDQFINRAIEELHKMEDEGLYAKELKVNYLKFLNLEKTNIPKLMLPFESLDFSDSAKIMSFIQSKFEEVQTHQFNQTEAFMNIKSFKKLYYKENKLELSPTAVPKNEIDSVK